jgi:hypothetical protein
VQVRREAAKGVAALLAMEAKFRRAAEPRDADAPSQEGVNKKNPGGDMEPKAAEDNAAGSGATTPASPASPGRAVRGASLPFLLDEAGLRALMAATRDRDAAARRGVVAALGCTRLLRPGLFREGLQVLGWLGNTARADAIITRGPWQALGLSRASCMGERPGALSALTPSLPPTVDADAARRRRAAPNARGLGHGRARGLAAGQRGSHRGVCQHARDGAVRGGTPRG